MKIDPKILKEIIEKNPQVDADLLISALSEANAIQNDSEKMVNFKIRLPYSSDNFEDAIQNSWEIK